LVRARYLGLAKTQAHLLLVAFAFNMRRLAAHAP
jgi:IS5 family transposase